MKISKCFRNNALVFLITTSALLLFSSCGSSINDPEPGSGNGKVALFISDNISMYKQVVGTITSVRLINSGVSDQTCEVLSTPVTLDIANLTNIAQYIHLTECKAGKYNRVDINIKKDVHLMDQLDAVSSCAFTSVFKLDGSEEPLFCDLDTGVCTVSIRGGVRDEWINVQEDKYNDLGIDFNLKQFTVADFGQPSCSVTMAAATISASDFNESGRAHSVTGPIADLDTSAKSFTLVASGASLTVDYSTINPALQPDMDVLLQTAETEGLKVNVRTGGIDLETSTISANRIYLKVAGTVSNITQLQGRFHFTLTYGPSLSIEGIQKPQADVQGTFTDGTWADVKFDGYDGGASPGYLAQAIEILPNGMVLDD